MRIYRGVYKARISAGRIAMILLALVVSVTMPGCSSSGEADISDGPGGYAGSAQASGEADGTFVNLSDDSDDGNADTLKELGTADRTLRILYEASGEKLHLFDDLTHASLYRFETTGDPLAIVPFAAEGMPADVTAELSGTFGIKKGESGKAYLIKLRSDLKREDGIAITADNIVDAVKRTVTDTGSTSVFVNGNVSLYNAKAYSEQGLHVYSPLILGSYSEWEYIASQELSFRDGILTCGGEDNDVVVNIYKSGMYSACLDDYYRQGAFKGIKREYYRLLFEGKADAAGNVKLTEDSFQLLKDLVAAVHGYDTEEDYLNENGGETFLDWEEYCLVGSTNRLVDFSEVGIYAPAADELILVFEEPVCDFVLLEAFTDSMLFGDLGGGLSFGPYRYVKQDDDGVLLERNPYFFGYSDKSLRSCYEPERIVISDHEQEPDLTVADPARELSEQEESRSLRVPDGSVEFIVFNPSFDNLEEAEKLEGDNINKTIVTIEEFRHAVSLAIDRERFVDQSAPGFIAANGLFPSGSIADISSAKEYSYAERKLYDSDKAKIYFNNAYQQALVYGYLDNDDTVSLNVGIPDADDELFETGLQAVSEMLLEAVRGTLLEGKLVLNGVNTKGEDCATALAFGRVDMLVNVGWTGSVYDPYTLSEAYTAYEYRYDRSWPAESVIVNFEADGKSYTASIGEVTCIMLGESGEITDMDGRTIEFSLDLSSDPESLRESLLKLTEETVLSQHDMIPLVEKCDVLICSDRVKFPYGDNVVPFYRFGGIRDIVFLQK